MPALMPAESAASEAVVGVGDCRIAAPPAVTIVTHALGSCIAVVAWDRRVKQGGMLHVMLPDSSIDPARAKANPWVFADTGVPELLNRMKTAGSDPCRIRWSMAGGALMLGAAAHFDIGKKNHLALKKVFWRLGIFIEHEDTGGTQSRSVKLDLASGRIEVRRGSGAASVLAPGIPGPAMNARFERKTADARPAR